MQRAQQLSQTHLETGEGASEVARVLKAADGNLVRANGFLAYLNGEGENPFPAFYAEHGDGTNDGDAATPNAQE